MRGGLACGALLLLGACSSGEDAAAPPTGAATAAPAASEEPSAEPSDDEVQIVSATATSSPDGNDRAVKQESDYYDFDYAFPEQAAANPVLRKWFEDDIDRQRDRLIAGARKARDTAAADRVGFRRHALTTRWSAIADLPGFLSFSAFTYSFAGGAHGMTAFQSFVWDKQAVARRPTLTLFASPRALAKAIRAPFCAELDRMRAAKRAKAATPLADQFRDCVAPTKGTAVLTSSDAAHFDGVSLLIPPGSAGPTAEGSYEVELPVTAAVIAAVRPRFRKAFSARPTVSPNPPQ